MLERMLSEPATGSPISDRERELGLRVLGLLLKWSGWVHRRVETIYFESAETHRRRVSVDFTLPLGLQTPLAAGTGEEVHLTPLTLLKKRPLTNFDLRDEGGSALPLLTKERNGLLAAAFLAGLASIAAPAKLKEEHGERPPPDIDHALLRLALANAENTSIVERELDPKAGPSEASRTWRAFLLKEEQFLAFAHVLALNYLVVVPLHGPPGTRRIVKLAYDEPRTTRSAYPKNTAIRRARRRLLGWIVGEPVGPRRIRERRPGGLRRGLGFRSDVRVIEAPAVSYGSSYHLEFVAPDGLIVTRGDLVPLAGETPVTSAIRSLKRSRRRAQLYLPRNVLSVGGATSPGLIQGLGFVHLRPPPETLVRATTLLAGFTTAILLFVALRWASLVDNAGVVPGLLLIVPAGLAALITRSSEASITTQLLLGIRIAAILAALCAYVAAAILVGGRSCSSGLIGRTCSSWAATPGLLYALVGVSGFTTLALLLTWLFSARPPEQTQ